LFQSLTHQSITSEEISVEWIIGIYVTIGLFKGGRKLLADVPNKPMWMYTQTNQLLWALSFVMYVLLWPLSKG
jgi:hypothetical protein